MNNSGKWFHVIEAVLAVMVILMAAAMLLEKNSKQYRKISVVIQDAEDTQWAAFRYGLKMAAQDQKVELVVASTADALTKEEQLNTIKREIELGADAVIVQPVPGDDLEQKLRHLEKKVPIMLVEYTAAKEREKSQLPSVEPRSQRDGRGACRGAEKRLLWKPVRKKIWHSYEIGCTASDEQPQTGRGKGVAGYRHCV